MAIIKNWEPWGVAYRRSQVRDSLTYHGEEAVLLSMYREGDRVGRCPRCSMDAYDDGEQRCPVCYGTNFYDDALQQGGVKAAVRAWCLFTDHIVSEQYGQYGTLRPDQRMVQCEAFPMLVEHDFIVRVRNWDPLTHTVLEVGGVYQVEAVTRESLRTGSRYGQTREDVVGQSAQVAWVPPNTLGIHDYPVEGVSFPEFTITGSPLPTVVAQPDTKVVYVPVPDGSQPPPNTGSVVGAQLRWNPVFTFQQTAPSALWTITHTLGHDPEVTIVVDDEEVDGDVDYPDDNTVTIGFEDPQTGYAELV